jgi:hypothetical protein
VVKARCNVCDSEYLISLDSVPQSAHEFFRLFYSSTLEDQYTNPKVHAAVFWMYCSSKRNQKEQNYPADSKGKKDANTRLYTELSNEVRKIISQKHKRLQAKYGGPPFPEHRLVLKPILARRSRGNEIKVFVPEIRELEREEKRHLMCAELEKIVCGEVRAETASAIEKVRLQISNAIERRKEEQRRKEQQILQYMKQGKAGETEASDKTPATLQKRDISIIKLRHLKALERRNRIRIPKR